ncbi:hypothetical protein [Rhodococcus sp. UNC363MFTsu5.1]|uniref:hypothetical protein n=1 Tax=Rhodococcus sp. UNC363MFTsu5.1 TaxID=1449069 RepID=UPI0004832AFC|nr:hypothetical protein [Rhodococcus sp. UNC363MFTsu5.1]
MLPEIARWVGEPAKQRPTILQHWDGIPSVTLSKITSGARLLWIFHEDFPEQFGVFVHLTTDEAQSVFETPNDVGLLEGIRTRLRDRVAYVWRKDHQHMGAAPYRIPKRGSEPQFAEAIWSAAEAVKPMIDLRRAGALSADTRSVSEAVAMARTKTLAAAAAS